MNENFKELMKPKMRVKIVDEVQFCCKKMRDFYEQDGHSNIKFDSIDCVMIYKGRAITNCEFCGANIEIDVSVSHYGGE